MSNHDQKTNPPVYPAKSKQGWINPKTDSNRFKFLIDSYTGGGGYKSSKYLIPHAREVLEKFDLRKIKSRYSNSFKTIIDTHVSPIFRGDPTRNFGDSLADAEKEAFNLILEDADKSGTSYKQFTKKTARASKIYDSSFVVVEQAKNEGGSSDADLSDRSKLPYTILITPDKISDVSIDGSGAVVYFAWESIEYSTDKAGELVESKIKTIWTKDFWKREKDSQFESRGDNNLDYVPVFPLYPQENLDPSSDPLPYGMSWSLATINYRRFNLGSIIDETADGTAFPMMTITGPADIKSLTTGHSNGLKLPEGSTAQFLQPDYSFIDKLYSVLYTGLEQEMYQISGVNFMKTMPQSADSRRQEMERLYETLSDTKAQIEALDKKIMQTFADYMDIKIDYSVSYNQNFGMALINDDLKVFETFVDSGIVSDEVTGKMIKRIMGAMMTGLTETEKKQLDDSVDQHLKFLAEVGVVDPEDEDETGADE